MCGIVGSFDKDFILQGFTKVAPRGTRGASLTAIDVNKNKTLFTRNWFQSPEESDIRTALNIGSEPAFFVLHTVAPTGGPLRLHPATVDERYFLWHNGMVNDGKEHTEWDTLELLIDILRRKEEALNSFVGSFACVFLSEREGLQVFRNAISPLFARGTSFCSVPLDGRGLQSIEPNKVYTYSSTESIFRYTRDFNNTHNPFGV